MSGMRGCNTWLLSGAHDSSINYPSVLKVVFRVVEVHGYATFAGDVGSGRLAADLKDVLHLGDIYYQGQLLFSG